MELSRELVEFIKLLPQQRAVFESMSVILDQTKVVEGFFTPTTDDFKQEAIKRLPQVLEAIEFMIETYRRFEAFQVEVQAIEKLGISFREWLQLSPFIETKLDKADMMYIIPSQPLNLEFS